MVKLLVKFIISSIILSLFGILLLDYVLLPNYVGYNNEDYLPDVRGDYLEKASYNLNNLGFNTEIITVPFNDKFIPGSVIKMFPRAFTKVKKGRTITLTIAGKDSDILIPDMTNMTLRNAKLLLNKLNLGIDTIQEEYDNNIKKGHVTFQAPRKNTNAKSSTKVTLGISKGLPPDYYIVPDVVNLSIKKAKIDITTSGLRVGNIIYEFQPELIPNTVIDQSMTGGMRVSFPVSINLTVTKSKE